MEITEIFSLKNTVFSTPGNFRISNKDVPKEEKTRRINFHPE